MLYQVFVSSSLVFARCTCLTTVAVDDDDDDGSAIVGTVIVGITLLSAKGLAAGVDVDVCDGSGVCS